MDRNQALIQKYEYLLQDMERRYRHDPDLTLGQLEEVLKQSRTYSALESELSETELDLVERFLRRDLADYAQRHAKEQFEAEGDSVFTLGLENTVWRWLAEITDRSQLEWHELGEEFKHHGTYEAGELVGLGELVCDNCGHCMSFFHPATLPACPQCDGIAFSRRPLEP
ncbi:zinc ribbon-containing protein [Ferrimonas marina]|uniref:Zinc-ribbon containing domain-containing protein n=1 Tax=Ferrimonas marina TaxID=299255 RepID=A0A1M5W0D5_9GAMM|nr:zinc ribbon-containing protein [Ferrimonas marina]SHH80674.1 Zinc-ribbon containing domain-containing protein [Ferrimonas marina]